MVERCGRGLHPVTQLVAGMCAQHWRAELGASLVSQASNVKRSITGWGGWGSSIRRRRDTSHTNDPAGKWRLDIRLDRARLSQKPRLSSW